MDHAHIAQLLQVYDEADKVYLVMEHCSGGSLLSRLWQQRGLSEREARDAVRQLVRAVRYCHGRPGGAVCHRDLKPENMVYSSGDKGAPLKLVDFGLSCVAEPGGLPAQDSVGTLDFIAPEVLARRLGCRRSCWRSWRRRGHGPPCDMWAVGVIAHLLLTKGLPFGGEDDAERARAIVACEVDFETPAWLGVSRPAREFVARLLRADPADRMTADEALLHPWLSQQAGCTPWLPGCQEVLQRLRAFAGMGAARRACCALTVYGHVLSPEGRPEAEDIRLAEEQFQALDTDGNGAIELVEFTSALAEGLGVGPEESQSIFKRLDLIGENRIERSQFLAAVVGSRLLGHSGAVQEAFQRFDADGSGSISPSEMTGLLGPQFCGENVTKIFGEMDINSDSTVDFDEFCFVVSSV
jgi:calcium-dependent protein kinase